jgi:hypothetical protein
MAIDALSKQGEVEVVSQPRVKILNNQVAVIQVGSTQSYVDLARQNCCYSKVIFHYSASGNFSTKYEKLWYTAVSMSYGMYYSRSLECGGYQNNECFATNNHRFRGSKLEGPGININSTQTIDGGPVITVWEVNPNSLRVGDSPLGGKLTVT